MRSEKTGLRATRSAALRRLGALITLALLAGTPALQAQDNAAPTASVPEGAVGGMGDINLFPKRVIIDARQRIATVGLYNRAITAGEYEILVGDKMMQPDGSVVDLDTVSDPVARARVKGASAFLRWSPRQVVLGGSESQTIRIMLRPDQELAPGEYRAHFTALAVPPANDANSIENVAAGQGGSQIGVRIVPRFGISIPVIVRVGETTLQVGIEAIHPVTTADGRKALALRLTRQGTRSAYGDVTVMQGSTRLAQLRGVGVYPEIDGRTVTVPLGTPASLAPGTRLTVTFTDDDVEPGKVLASREFTVP